MSAFPDTLFSGRRFAVVGLGQNGRPAAAALLAMGAEVVAWDDQETARAAAADLPLRDLREGALNFDAIVLSPGIPHILPKPHPIAARAIAAGIPIVSDVELLFQAVRRARSRARFVGITGTNGKSTTTALLAHVLHHAGVTAAAGANLGPAALSLPLLPDDGVYVLEMSSYMLERIHSVRFDAAAMLNLSADHIDRHGDMAGYALAKRAIFDRQTSGDLAVIGVEDAGARAMADWLDTRPARVVRVSGAGAKQGAARADVWCEDGVLRDASGPILSMADAIALPGAHNAQNAAAAAAMATFLGVRRDRIAAGIASYPGLPHRQQRIVTVDGVTFVNDSKATNADAAERALICYDRLIWIAGGLGKEGGIVPLAPYFPRIARAMLIGRDAPIFARTLSEHGVPFDMVETLDAAVPAAFAAAKREHAPVVLLSPATASWDQFRSYEHRGERFAELTRELAAGDGDHGSPSSPQRLAELTRELAAGDGDRGSPSSPQRLAELTRELAAGDGDRGSPSSPQPLAELTRELAAGDGDHGSPSSPQRLAELTRELAAGDGDRGSPSSPQRHGPARPGHQRHHDVVSDGPVEPGHDGSKTSGHGGSKAPGPGVSKASGHDGSQAAGPDGSKAPGHDGSKAPGPDGSKASGHGGSKASGRAAEGTGP